MVRRTGEQVRDNEEEYIHNPCVTQGAEIPHLRPTVKLSLKSDRRLASSPVRGHFYVGAIERANGRATE